LSLATLSLYQSPVNWTGSYLNV